MGSMWGDSSPYDVEARWKRWSKHSHAVPHYSLHYSLHYTPYSSSMADLASTAYTSLGAEVGAACSQGSAPRRRCHLHRMGAVVAELLSRPTQLQPGFSVTSTQLWWHLTNDVVMERDICLHHMHLKVHVVHQSCILSSYV